MPRRHRRIGRRVRIEVAAGLRHLNSRATTSDSRALASYLGMVTEILILSVSAVGSKERGVWLPVRFDFGHGG
jgi:hypothetical protein